MAKKSDLEARIAQLEAELALLRARIAQMQVQTPIVIHPQPAWPGTYPTITCEANETFAGGAVMLKRAS